MATPQKFLLGGECASFHSQGKHLSAHQHLLSRSSRAASQPAKCRILELGGKSADTTAKSYPLQWSAELAEFAISCKPAWFSPENEFR